MNKMKPCPECKGLKTTKDLMKICGVCGGTGEVRESEVEDDTK